MDNNSNGKIIINSKAFSEFIAVQIMAIVMLGFTTLVVSILKSGYEDGVDYIPIMVTYISTIDYYEENEEGQMEQRYRNTFSYVVDGITYRKTSLVSERSIPVGTQEEWYYNPNNPQNLERHRNYEEASGFGKLLWGGYGFVQICAILCLIASMVIPPKPVQHEKQSMVIYDSVFDGPDLEKPEEFEEPERTLKVLGRGMQMGPHSETEIENNSREGQDEVVESKVNQYGFRLNQE